FAVSPSSATTMLVVRWTPRGRGCGPFSRRPRAKSAIAAGPGGLPQAGAPGAASGDKAPLSANWTPSGAEEESSTTPRNAPFSSNVFDINSSQIGLITPIEFGIRLPQ